MEWDEWGLTDPNLIGPVLVLVAVGVGLGLIDETLASLYVSGLTPLVVVFLGYAFNRRLKESQFELEQYREEARLRRNRDRIEFTIDATFHGPTGGYVLAEFVVHVHNKSLVKHYSRDITLRVRGLERNEAPAYRLRGGREHEVAFPIKLFEENVVPEPMRPIFVEPNVDQPITYVTRVDETIGYVLAHARFNYLNKPDEKGHEPHTVERVFTIPSRGES
ncbi:hypothetical protein [Salinigranum salinum]|uniref:hypothetical protein n=1 Tax=Salinigranum salinum TaxID=1364937 RepID=UPI0012605974|nr:hypothetical protein [Salinigranum salinum]